VVAFYNDGNHAAMLKPKKDPLGLGFLIIKPNKTHNYLGFLRKDV